MKKTLLITLATALAVTCTAVAGSKISVPVQAYAPPPAYFEVNATAARELDHDGTSVSYVWFGGKITNQTRTAARYELTISFFDARGNELGGTTFKGTVNANDHVNIPEKQTLMDASEVKQIYSAKYALILK